VLYQIKLHGWGVSWSFGLASAYYSRADEGSYSECLLLTLKGQVMYPGGFKYPDVECLLSADPRLSQGVGPATSIGSLTATESRLMAYNYHITTAITGWELKKQGATRASKTAKTKAEIVKVAGEFFEGKTASLKVHKEDGTIQEERTYPRSADLSKSKG